LRTGAWRTTEDRMGSEILHEEPPVMFSKCIGIGRSRD
jgi:hypothetical protein